MGPEHYYNVIQNEHMNKCVEIRCHDGKVHRGIVRQLDRTHVYLEPIDGAEGGPGVYAWGFFWWPIALASIAWIAAWPWLW